MDEQEVDPDLANPQLKFSDGLAKLGLNFSAEQVTGSRLHQLIRR